MSSAHDPPRPVHEVLGAGVMTGVITGLAVGAIDALWSWGPAGQFSPTFLSKVRFVLFVAAAHAAAGVVVGLVAAAALLLLSRATRLGDLVRYVWRDHQARRHREPRDALAPLAFVLAATPSVGIALYVTLLRLVPALSTRKEWNLIVLVAMGAALGALLVGLVIGVVLARPVEELLRLAARRPAVGRVLSSPFAPIVAVLGFTALAAAIWAASTWDTTKTLGLRGLLVAVVGCAFAIPAWRWALLVVGKLAGLAALPRRAAWTVLPFALLGLVLASGGNPGTVKAASAYSGLAPSIIRTLRKAFDWDRDGYSRFLGGGDCDDGDASVHPGATDVPGDGIDQNCVGGDAPMSRPPADPEFTAVPPGVPKDFNVLLVTIDTTRADHLGTYGYERPTSPNLDALGKEGAVFEHAWAHAPSTRYSMPAILTGRLPLDVRYDTRVAGWPGLDMANTTIAESLAPLGFHTGAILNYEYFGAYRHMDQGIAPADYDNTNMTLHQPAPGAGPEQTRGSSSRQQSDKAIAWTDKHKAERWFLWVHYYDPHYAYETHAEVPSFGDDAVARYDGEIRFTDMHLGRLFAALRAQGVYDKTVVVVTGDHGEGFGEHKVDFHGYHLYAAQTKVPLIIRVPGMPPRRSTTPAGHVDILPTLVNLAGGPPTQDMMGSSLVRALAGDDRDRVVFQQLSYENNHEMRGAASRNCHILYNISPDTSWEEYRVDRDPMETTDVEGQDECTETREAFERWYDSQQVPVGASEALLTARPTLAAPLDVELGDSVRLLGVEAPATAKGGTSVPVTWTFEARGTVEPGWKVFAHLEGGGSYANFDHQPARPFEWWKPGQFIRYTTSIGLPTVGAPTTYTLRVGMFKGDQRAKARSPRAPVVNDGVAAATIEVTP